MQNETLVFGAGIKAIRDFYEYSQAEVASMTGLDVSAISFLEVGNRPPTLKTMAKVAHGLGVSVSRLLAIGERNIAGESLKAAQLMAAREGSILVSEEVAHESG